VESSTSIGRMLHGHGLEYLALSVRRETSVRGETPLTVIEAEELAIEAEELAWCDKIPIGIPATEST
jgi:hypothetical protein